jgi:hypothetical protein
MRCHLSEIGPLLRWLAIAAGTIAALLLLTALSADLRSTGFSASAWREATHRLPTFGRLSLAALWSLIKYMPTWIAQIPRDILAPALGTFRSRTLLTLLALIALLYEARSLLWVILEVVLLLAILHVLLAMLSFSDLVTAMYPTSPSPSAVL